MIFQIYHQLRLIYEWCLRGMITNYTFVNIINGFQETLHCACAIKIPAISQFPTPTGLNPKKSLTFIKSHWIA